MSILPVGFGSSGVDVGDIANSLRFRSSASAYLSRTFGTPTNNKIFTLSGWLKRGVIGVNQTLLSAYSTSNTFTDIYINSANQLYYSDDQAGTFQGRVHTNMVFRDPSSTYHVVVSVDTSQAIAADRIKIYVNGVEVSYTIDNAMVLNRTPWINYSTPHRIGAFNTTEYLDGYLSRICFVDGSALTPDSFGYLNTEINEWVSLSQSAVKAVVDAGGTNSFMLDFDDASGHTTSSNTGIGKDLSLHGNYWADNNISLTAGVTYDHMLDVPGNSFATLNPLIASAANISDANLKAGATSVTGTQNAVLFSSYWQVIAQGGSVTAGVINPSGATYTTTIAANKTYGFRLTPGGAFEYKNITDAGSWTTISTGFINTWFPYGVGAAVWHFGQQPWWSESPPTGFKALCQANLPAIDPATLLDPTDHHIDITVTKSGDTDFTLPWDASVYDTFFEIKRRDAAGDWYQIDGLRGYDKILKSNSTAAETTDANVLGISGTTGTLKSTLADGTYIISATKAGLTASRQTNTDGTITSTVSRNVDSGFAIVTWVGTGANGTVGHGLGNAPNFVPFKNRQTVTSWPVYSKVLGFNYWLWLDQTAAQQTGTNLWGGADPTTTTFSVGTAANSNELNKSMVAYCYADSDIQKSFSYTGNGLADGPFVHCGFKPKYVLIKRIDVANWWVIWDSARNSYNADPQAYLQAESSNYENNNGASPVDILDATANGFKLRTSALAVNTAGTYIFAAFADVSGKYSNAR